MTTARTTTTTTHETELWLLPAPLPQMEDREKVISDIKLQSDELEDEIKIEKEKLLWDEILKEYQKEEQPEMALEEVSDVLVLGFASVAADVVTYLLKAVVNVVNDRLQRYWSGYACKFSKQVECQLYVKDEPTPVLKYKYLRLTQYAKKSSGGEDKDGRSIVFDLLAEMTIKNNVAIKIQPLRVYVQELACLTSDEKRSCVSVSLSADVIWKEGATSCQKKENVLQVKDFIAFECSSGLPLYLDKTELEAGLAVPVVEPLLPCTMNGNVVSDHLVTLRFDVCQVGYLPWWKKQWDGWFNKQGADDDIQALVNRVEKAVIARSSK